MEMCEWHHGQPHGAPQQSDIVRSHPAAAGPSCVRARGIRALFHIHTFYDAVGPLAYTVDPLLNPSPPALIWPGPKGHAPGHQGRGVPATPEAGAAGGRGGLWQRRRLH
jgi:hypothetical protein